MVVGLLAAVVYLYSQGLGWLRGKVAERNVPADAGPFDAAELERYARHITLREIGGTGQRRLKEARVLIIGAGGLGSPAGMYLAAAGVGTIGIIDDDKAELPNLQRQIAHTDARSGHMKVFSAETAMLAINPRIKLRPYNRRFDARIAEDLLDDYDLLLDGSDNFETRYLANRVATKAGKPLISAALSQWEGQISLYDPARGTPCYACIFPKPPEPGLAPSCAEAGVLGPLTGVIGAMMAAEAVKYITQAGETLAGRMLIFDALYAETRVISLTRKQDCPVCGAPLGEAADAR
jgi:molybdopterin/thiamine biosynthesis adenylyltransferase